MNIKSRKTLLILRNLSVLVLAGSLGAATFILSGTYDIAAKHPHLAFVRDILLLTKKYSVQYHAKDLEVPSLDNPELIKKGFYLYRTDCVTCHGAPGEARSKIGIGLNPNPPPLERAIEEWTTAEISWIITYGLKMAGMPAYGLGKSQEELWALTAFVKRLNTLSPAEYRKMLQVAYGNISEEEVSWLPAKGGWSKLIQADPIRGRKLLGEYGCTSCHIIPGVIGARGMAGPPLTNWSKRHYIAGILTNVPNNLIPWIMNPQTLKPETVMPDLKVSEGDAIDMSSYLYTIDQKEDD